MIKFLLAAWVICLLFLWSFSLKASNSKKSFNLEYNGLLWVILDAWSIWKYKSNDTVMKWINVKIEYLSSKKKNETLEEIH